MYDMGIWEVTDFWNKSSLGNIKDIMYNRIVASDFNWYGNWWFDLHSSSSSAGNWNHNVDHSKNIISEKGKYP